MKSTLDELQELADSDLYALCEAVDMEMQRREGLTSDLPDSARRRALEQGESYRRPHRCGRCPPGRPSTCTSGGRQAARPA